MPLWKAKRELKTTLVVIWLILFKELYIEATITTLFRWQRGKDMSVRRLLLRESRSMVCSFLQTHTCRTCHK
jgi:hypothetical protein